MFSSSSATRPGQHPPQQSSDLVDRLMMNTGLAEKRRKEMYQEIFRKPRLIPEMARLGEATKPRAVREYSCPQISFTRCPDESMDDGDSSAKGHCAAPDWFEQRAPDEDELSDEDDPDTRAEIQREIAAGFPAREHKAEWVACCLDKSAVSCLEIIIDLQPKLLTLTDQLHNHPDALRIARFARLVPLRLMLIFLLDGQNSLHRTLATIEWLKRIQSAVDGHAFEALEPRDKQRLWEELNQAGESLEEGYLTLRGIVEHADLFEVKKNEEMDELMLDQMVGTATADPTHGDNELLKASYSQLARFNYALSEVVNALIFFGALFKRAQRSVELWKALVFSGQLDLSSLAGWSVYWIEVFVACTQAFTSLESRFGSLTN